MLLRFMFFYQICNKSLKTLSESEEEEVEVVGEFGV